MPEGKQYFSLAVFPAIYPAVIPSFRLSVCQAARHAVIPTVRLSVLLAVMQSCSKAIR
jgi:hypothetical protein